MQTHRESIIEAIANVVVGFCISYVVTHSVLALLGMPISSGNNFILVGLLTGTSFIRAYLLRRWFTSHRIKDL